jgi:hypothetical protein
MVLLPVESAVPASALFVTAFVASLVVTLPEYGKSSQARGFPL